MKPETNFQQYLLKRVISWKTISQELNIDTSLPCKWAHGTLYPARTTALRIMRLFKEHGYDLDYNDLYQHHYFDNAV